MKNEWTRIMSNYKKALKRRESRSGDGGNNRPEICEFFNELCFLHEISSPRETYGNLSVSSVDDLTSPTQELSSPPPPSPTVSYVSINSPLGGALTQQNGTSSSQNNAEKVKQYNNYAERRKRKQNSSEMVDALLVKALNEESSSATHSQMCNENIMEDPDSLFCRSLVGQMKQFTPRKKSKARFKISQVMFDLMDDTT